MTSAIKYKSLSDKKEARTSVLQEHLKWECIYTEYTYYTEYTENTEYADYIDYTEYTEYTKYIEYTT